MKPLLTVVFTFLVSVALAQQSDLNKPVQLKKGWMRIDAIMQEIYKQGGLKFSFNSQQINPAKKVRITNERLSVGAVLHQVEETAAVKFKVVGRHIVLLNQATKKKPVTGTLDKNKSLNKNVKQASRARQNTASKASKPGKSSVLNQKASVINLSAREGSINASVAVKSDSLLVLKRIDSISNYAGKATPALSQQFFIDTSPVVTRPEAAALLPVDKQEREKNFWVSVGANGTELSYVNPGVRTGYKNLYAIVTMENCTCSPQYRWGIGYAQEINSNWQLHHNLTTSTTAALYPAETIPEVLVKNRHFKWSVLVNKTVVRKVNIQLGPVINVLQTRYFSSNGEGRQQKVAAGSLLPETMDGDKVFTSTEAPYTLFNTYKNDRAVNWKGWIGAELGVYYKIPFSLKK